MERWDYSSVRPQEKCWAPTFTDSFCEHATNGWERERKRASEAASKACRMDADKIIHWWVKLNWFMLSDHEYYLCVALEERAIIFQTWMLCGGSSLFVFGSLVLHNIYPVVAGPVAAAADCVADGTTAGCRQPCCTHPPSALHSSTPLHQHTQSPKSYGTAGN